MAGGTLRLQQTVPNDPNALDLILDQERTTKAADEVQLAVVNQYLGLTDAALIPLGVTREQFQDQWEVLNARILAYGWPRHDVTLNVVDGDWLSPDSVEALSVCGESGANVATNSIDGNTTTHWRHTVDERHSIIYKLRDFPLRAERIRFWYTGAVNEELTDLDVRMAKEKANLGDAGNLLEDGLNLTWTGTDVWIEHTLATPKASAVYIQLDISNSNSTGNTIQIREFEVFCTPKKA